MHARFIENGINFRELGGIKTTNGGTLKKGVLFRSGALSSLTHKECQILSETLKIMSVLDYRDTSEVQENPDKLWPGSTYYSAPANPMDHLVNANILQEIRHHSQHRTGREFMLTLYEMLPFANRAYKQLISLLLEPEIKPMIQHCAVGKDRTGIGSALTLFALGVDEDTVMADYLLTEPLLRPLRAKMLEQLADKMSPKEYQFQKALFDTHPDYLSAAIAAIKKQYHSIENWLARDYGLTPDDRRRLQNKYLE